MSGGRTPPARRGPCCRPPHALDAPFRAGPSHCCRSGDEHRHRFSARSAPRARRHTHPAVPREANNESDPGLRIHEVRIDCHDDGVVIFSGLVRHRSSPVSASKTHRSLNANGTGSVSQQHGVVGDFLSRDDFERPRVPSSPIFSRRAATAGLVRRHHGRHRPPLTPAPVASRASSAKLLVARDQEREDHEPDDESGNVGEEDRDHPGHDRADRILELASPDARHPDTEPNPAKVRVIAIAERTLGRRPEVGAARRIRPPCGRRDA